MLGLQKMLLLLSSMIIGSVIGYVSAYQNKTHFAATQLINIQNVVCSVSIVLHAFWESIWSCREQHCASGPHHQIISSNCSFTEQSPEGVFTPPASCFLFMPHQHRDGLEGEAWKRSIMVTICKLLYQAGHGFLLEHGSALSRWQAAYFFPCRRSTGHCVMSPVTTEIWPFASERTEYYGRKCLSHQRLDRTTGKEEGLEMLTWP